MFKIIVLVFSCIGILLADGPVLKTGQTAVYKAGDDGSYQAGTARAYMRSAAGVVTDNATGLQWQDVYPAMLPGQICYGMSGFCSATWADATAYCTGLGLDGGGWRLPGKHELKSLVDYGRANPAIDPIFQNAASDYYWSSTTVAIGTFSAWDIHFGIGSDSGDAKTASHYVRCVRGGGAL